MKKLHLLKPDAAPRGDSLYVYNILPHNPQVCGQRLLMESCQPVLLTPLQPHLCFQTGHATRYMGTSWQSEVETLSSELAECSTTGAPLYLMWTFWSIFHFYILVWVDPCSPYFACICSTSHQQYHSLVSVQGIHYFFFDNLKKKSVRIFTGCFFSLDSVKNYKSAILRMDVNIRSSIILCFEPIWTVEYVCITAQSTSLRAETVDGVIPAWPLNITAAKLLFPARAIRPIHGDIMATCIQWICRAC